MPEASRQCGMCAYPLVAAATAGICCALHANQTWPVVAGAPSHHGVSNSIALPHGNAPAEATLAPAWITSTDEHGRPFAAIAAQTPTFDDQRVYISARVTTQAGPQWRLLAVERSGGTATWSSPISPPLVDSFSSATVDSNRGQVIIASGRDVVCFDAQSGAQTWSRRLARNVVNASPVIADDVEGRARAFITDYDGFGQAASLYCINIDEHSDDNPFDPGEVIWSVLIGGASGATPAFLPACDGGTGLVYVATRGEPSFVPGTILAFDAYANNSPSPAFITHNAIDEGFYGTISIEPPSNQSVHPTLYAVSYEFYGGLASANLIAVDGVTGSVRWSMPSNRGASAPVLLGNGRIAVSAGVQGYGTLPSVALYLDRKDHALELWNIVRDSWTDHNNDHVIDPDECDSVGLWSYQPIASSDLRLLSVGVAPESASVGAFGPSMATLDVALAPWDRTFTHRTAGISGSPSAGRGCFYAINASGLVAFAMPRIDVNSDGRATIDDLCTFERGNASNNRRDVTGDGTVNGTDRATLLGQLRVHEAGRMSAGRN